MRSLRTYALLLLLAASLAACGATPTPLPLAEPSTLTPSPAATLPAPTEVPLTATATRAPTRPPPTDTPTPVLPPAASPLPGQVQITIAYDNTAVEPGLDVEWGFAAWIDYGELDILFDTGPGGPALLGNLAQLGLDPAEIDVVVLSHDHGDHTGGMTSLLQTGVRPVVYVPSSFGASYKSLLRERTDLVEVAGPTEILPGLHSTGELRTTLPGQAGLLTEQALVIETAEGSVVVTGCAHPGIVSIVRAAQAVVPGDVALVMGGFHLMDKFDRAVEAVATSLLELGVEQVSPTHCTGEQAIAILAAAHGDDYIEGGAGRVYVVGASSVSDQPSGLTPDQIASLRSLQQVGDYPLYVMHYYDKYEPRIYAQEPVSSSAGAWACSLFAALGNGEDRLYGRNFDWQFSPALLLFTDPPDGYASVSMVDLAYFGFDDQVVRSLSDLSLDDLVPLLDTPHWPFDGMNAQGLVVGMAAVPSGGMQPDPDKPTIGSLGVIREILDHAADVDEALAQLQAYNIEMKGGPDLHYLVADRSGRALLVEFYRGQMVVTPNEQPWHLATNFVTASVASPADASCWRFNQIEAALSHEDGHLDPGEAMALLSEVSQGNTQWSVVYGMSTGDIQVAMGRQYDSPHTFQLPLLKSTTTP